jgi:type I restriction enzyme S subunit
MTLLKDVPIGLAGGALSYNQDVRCLHPKDAVSGEYLAYLLVASRPQLMSLVTQAGHGTGRLDSDQLLQWAVPIPPKAIQDWLTERMRPIDHTLERLKRLVSLKRRFKRGLMQDLLTGRRRFPEFVQTASPQPAALGWRKVHIGAIAIQSSSRAGKQDLPVLSCTKHSGLVLSSSFFGKQVFSRDLANYKIVRRGQFAYATNHLEEGSIGLLEDREAGVVSPMYTVFEITQDDVDPQYLFAVLKSEPYVKLFRRITSGSVNRRGALRWNAFKRIEILLPSLMEQRRIVRVLRSFDHELELLTALEASYETKKRGLMQKLLSGDIEVPQGLGTLDRRPDHDGDERHDDS